MDKVAPHSTESIDNNITTTSLGYVLGNLLRSSTEPTLLEKEAERTGWGGGGGEDTMHVRVCVCVCKGKRAYEGEQVEEKLNVTQ